MLPFSLTVVNEDPAVRTGEPSDRQQELEGLIAALEHGPADVLVLKKLALLCRENPVNEPISPISPDFSEPLSPSPLFGSAARTLPGLRSDLWSAGKAFERLFAALVLYLDPSKVRDNMVSFLLVPSISHARARATLLFIPSSRVLPS